MEPFNTPKVFVNQPIPKSIFNQGKNKWLIKVMILVAILTIPVIMLIRNHQEKLSKTSVSQQNQTKAQSKIPQILSQHPELFYANLELDPKTNIVTLRNMGKTNGDRPNYFLQPPISSSTDFIYKVEVTSDKNEVLQRGWNSVPKEVITNPKGIYRFTLTTVYQPNASVRLYLPSDQIIWTGKIL